MLFEGFRSSATQSAMSDELSQVEVSVIPEVRWAEALQSIYKVL